MMQEVRIKTGSVMISNLPDKCPFCHRGITPNIIYGYILGKYDLDVFLVCPDKRCYSTFVGSYQRTSSSGYYNFQNKVTKGNILEAKFDDAVKTLSDSFVTIYNQAFFAEQEGLLEICGVGYRKALEFLIKDYAIDKNPEDKEEIEKKFLSSCIKEYVNDYRVKSVAERAVWIGNDETHYVRRWEGRNLEDLKKLIELTVHWIQMEKLTDSFETEMSK